MAKRPRHPEVDQEHTTATKPKNQILAASLESLDDLAVQFGCDLLGIERTRDPGIGDLDQLEPTPDECRLQARANRLDLRQLGHGASVARGPRYASVSRMTPPVLGLSSVSS
jgi:hypothetical protein